MVAKSDRALSTENSFHRGRQIPEGLFAVAGETGAVHDGERFGFEVCQAVEDLVGLFCVGDVVGQWSGLHLLHRSQYLF